MKTSINLSILLTSLFGLTHLTAEAQYSTKLWARVSDSSSTPRILDNGTIGSNNIDFATALNTRGVYQVSQALSHSRIPKLQAVYEFNCNCSSDELETTLRNFPNVISEIERAPVYKTLYTPNDYNAVFSSNYALELIKAPQAWNLTQSNSSIIIGISDENLNPNHEELVGKLIHYDMHNTQATEHGTAVAIIAAGNTDNHVGMSSIGFNSSIAFYQMSFDELLAASYAGVDILNISWFSGCTFSQIEQDIINEVYSNGTFIIAAAGNGSTCGNASAMAYPASYQRVFSVTSIGAQDNHEEIVGDGTSTHQHNTEVDLCAPGYKINISDNPNHYFTGSGSSYAAPYVSGTVALMLSVNHCLDNQEIENILKNSSNNIDVMNQHYIGSIGAGRLNANAAVSMALHFQNNMSVITSVENGCTEGSGAISVITNNGQTPYSITWNNGMTGDFNANLNNGFYTFQVVDAHGCVGNATASINSSSPVIENSGSSNVTCNGETNGSIFLTVSEGNPDYIYQWSNGGTSQSINQLTSGTYFVQVTDQNGCFDYTSFEITEPLPLILSTNIIPDLGNNDGAINLNIMGGTPNYSFQWSNGSTSEDLTGLNAGVYDLLVTDFNGCTITISAEVLYEGTANNPSSLNDISLSIYPNPTTGDVKISWNGDVSKLTVTEQSGRVVMNRSAQNGEIVEMLNLDAGLYILTIQSSNGSTATKQLVVL